MKFQNPRSKREAQNVSPPLPAFEEPEGMRAYQAWLPLECLEVYGGNRRVNHAVQLPGLDGWVHSDPAEPARSGGDVHYISVCGTISRFALADVSGHGQSSDIVAQLLRDLIHKYINTWDQTYLSIGRLHGRIFPGIDLQDARLRPFAV